MMNFLKKLSAIFSQLKKLLMHNSPSVTSWAYSINLFFVDPADLRVGTGEQEELMAFTLMRQKRLIIRNTAVL